MLAYVAVFLLVLFSVVVFKNVKTRLKYWKNLNVPYLSAIPTLKGLKTIMLGKFSMSESMLELHNYFSGRYGGIFMGLSPVLYVKDLDLIKKITIKDFDHFVDHTNVIISEADPIISKNLLALDGDRWRHMRATLSPSFTSSKMKFLFTLMSDCAQNVTEYFDREVTQKSEEIDFKDVCRRYTNDVIASSAFGVALNSLRDKDNEFFRMGNELMSVSFTRILRNLGYFLFPKLYQFFRITLFSARFNNFFMNVIKENIKARETQGIIRADMIHLLLQARRGKPNKDETPTKFTEGFAAVDEEITTVHESFTENLTDEDITAQAMIFFLAGFENAATVLGFACYELAINREIQERLQDEIDESFKKAPGGKVSYESLLSMKYLDMVVSETLRKWPVAVMMDRICVKDYTIEPSSPEEAGLVIKKGVSVQMPIFGLHHDPEHFPEPEVFNPERFSDENKQEVKQFSYVPFGAGPRNCIGSRFALLEIKILCFYLFLRYNVSSSRKELVLAKKILLEPEGGFKLKFEKRK